MGHETTRRVSAAFARRALSGRALPKSRTCAIVAVTGKAAAGPLPLRRVVSICNEPERGGYLLDTDDREWRP